MTLPASGAISIGQVATELGIGLPLSLGDPRVLALAGKSAPPISLSDLYGKSAYTPMTGYGVDGYASGETSGVGSSFQSQIVLDAVVSLGAPAYTYQWSFVSNGIGATVIGSSNNRTFTVSHLISRFGFTGSCTAQCVVTDTTGRTITLGPVTAAWEYTSGI